jgi:hypothetical protein
MLNDNTLMSRVEGMVNDFRDHQVLVEQLKVKEDIPADISDDTVRSMVLFAIGLGKKEMCASILKGMFLIWEMCTPDVKESILQEQDWRALHRWSQKG